MSVDIDSRSPPGPRRSPFTRLIKRSERNGRRDLRPLRKMCTVAQFDGKSLTIIAAGFLRDIRWVDGMGKQALFAVTLLILGGCSVTPYKVPLSPVNRPTAEAAEVHARTGKDGIGVQYFAQDSSAAGAGYG